MTEDLQITKDITRDLLDRIGSPLPDVREGAVEALAVSTGDEDWRPDELIEQGGIDIIAALLHDKKTHVVLAALDIIIAIAAAGEEEELITDGVIDRLTRYRTTRICWYRKKCARHYGS